MTKIKKANYRQRIYQAEDGTIVIVYGDDLPPSGAKLLADQDVVEVVNVTDHVEV